MNTHCPVCGKEYGVFDKMTHPSMCGDCFKAGKVREASEPVLPASAAAQKLVLPPIQDSVVAIALTVIAVLEFIGSPIAGLAVGQGNPEAGWLVFVSGVISGLILLGFAQVIQNTFETSQRLQRLEMIIESGYDNKTAA